jgi:hypothetical protein
MFTVASLWIPFTVTAACGQVARNAMQRSLTGPLGTWGATNIRFLFGFPFSLIFFALVIAFTGDPVPWPAAPSGCGCCSARSARSSPPA